ncbi:hypothetical protein GCM10022287_00660 [Gryllotalpicola koreensis]|uniref:Uncharacterized protein n=1 Tax=Gryllotalpicola koreensis TaxID=993086 RepID=A0ABP7ZPJ2_9MICO
MTREQHAGGRGEHEADREGERARRSAAARDVEERGDEDREGGSACTAKGALLPTIHIHKSRGAARGVSPGDYCGAHGRPDRRCARAV